ncbi:MAG: hypothetical protein GXX96_33600 [Planctomycetaceae bacterium]|nr:hypothetical protein [Planctomycetaceae bacterium]
MTRATTLLFGAALTVLLSATAPVAADDSGSAADGEKYLLRYQFKPGETVRWRVVHLAEVKTTVGGSTQTTESVSKSIKIWRVTEVTEDGAATFEYMVEQVDMWSKITGRQEMTYNSTTDEKVPVGFESVADSVGKRLSLITLNDRGEVIGRKDEHVGTTSPNEGQVTMTFPEEPVAVGETWSFPYEMVIPTNNGTVVKLNTQQKYSLERVKNGVATIEMATVILTPIHDPAIEAQVIQRQTEGTIRFDLDAGRVLSQQMDLDKRVLNFAGKNEPSSLHYLTRFTEDLVTEPPQTDELAEKDKETKTAAKPDEDTPERK